MCDGQGHDFVSQTLGHGQGSMLQILITGLLVGWSGVVDVGAHTVGGLCAGIAAHWLWVLLCLIF